MLYRPYGNTGKKISVISAGGMRYSNPKDLDAMAQIPLEAARLGVNYFDTAPVYSEDKSQAILGLALKEMKKEGLEHYVSTKSWTDTYDETMENIENSLKVIDIDHIDFMHCWGVNTLEVFEKRKKEGAIKALQDAKEQGLVTHIVFSSHMDGDGITTVAESELFEGVTLGLCAINFPYRMKGVRSAYQNNLGVVTMNPLGGGEIIRHADRFDFIKTRPEQSILEAALHFNLAHQEITSVLVGFTTVDDVRTAVATVDTFQPPNEEEIAAIQKDIEQRFDRLCTTCNYCKDCPEGIPVARFIEAYNYYMLYNEPEKPFERLHWHWDIDDLDWLERCTQCRECEDICTQKLPILERFEELKEMKKKVGILMMRHISVRVVFIAFLSDVPTGMLL